VQRELATYKGILRTAVGGRAASRAATDILDSIEVAHLESYVEQRRHPYTTGTGFPSIEILQFLHMRFSGMHMDQGFQGTAAKSCGVSTSSG